MSESAQNSSVSTLDDAIASSSSSVALLSWPALTTDTTVQQQNYSLASAEMEKLYLALHGIVMPCISVVGVVANFVNIIILSRLIKRGRSPLYHILLAMAVADFLLMGVVFIYCARFFIRESPIAVKENAEHIDAPSHFFFHTWDTFANICGMTSNWCVVAVTTFRFIAVHFPLHAHIWCTRHRARVAIVCIVAASIVMNVPYALVVKLNLSTGRFELQKDVNEAYKSTYYVAQLVVYHVIPWIASLVLVVLLLLRLLPQRQRIIRASWKQEEQKNIAQKKLSVTFICVAALFVVSTTPKVVYQFVTFSYDEASKFEYQPSVQCFFAASQLLLLLNYASNFFLYVFIFHAYRKNLITILRCRKSSTVAVHRLFWTTRAYKGGSSRDCFNGASATEERRRVLSKSSAIVGFR